MIEKSTGCFKYVSNFLSGDVNEITTTMLSSPTTAQIQYMFEIHVWTNNAILNVITNANLDNTFETILRMQI